MKKIFIGLIIIIGLPVIAQSSENLKLSKYIYHTHSERSYQHAHCSKLGGIEEYKLSDGTRVDCLTDYYAIEYDYCIPPKIYESVGQALHYSVMTGKNPKIVLILDKEFETKQKKYYYSRIKKIGDKYGIEVEYVNEEILYINNYGECSNPNCRCHKSKH